MSNSRVVGGVVQLTAGVVQEVIRRVIPRPARHSTLSVTLTPSRPVLPLHSLHYISEDLQH